MSSVLQAQVRVCGNLIECLTQPCLPRQTRCEVMAAKLVETVLGEERAITVRASVGVSLATPVTSARTRYAALRFRLTVLVSLVFALLSDFYLPVASHGKNDTHVLHL